MVAEKQCELLFLRGILLQHGDGAEAARHRPRQVAGQAAQAERPTAGAAKRKGETLGAADTGAVVIMDEHHNRKAFHQEMIKLGLRQRLMINDIRPPVFESPQQGWAGRLLRAPNRQAIEPSVQRLARRVGKFV